MFVRDDHGALCCPKCRDDPDSNLKIVDPGGGLAFSCSECSFVIPFRGS